MPSFSLCATNTCRHLRGAKKEQVLRSLRVSSRRGDWLVQLAAICSSWTFG